jgi:multiple sugar transport system substrate-binding protein
VLPFRDITDFEWDIAPIPLSPNSGERGTVVDTVSWSVAKDTTYPDAAWELVKFFTGEAGQLRMAEGGSATPSMIKYADSEARMRYTPTRPSPIWASSGMPGARN